MNDKNSLAHTKWNWSIRGIYSVGIIHVAASVIPLAASFFKAC